MAKHPNKHIREAIEYAEGNGWTFTKASGRAHIFRTLWCSRRDRTAVDSVFIQRHEVRTIMHVGFAVPSIVARTKGRLA